MRDQGTAAAGAENCRDASIAAARQSGDAASHDVARASPAIVDDRSPTVSGFAYVDGELHAEDVRLSAVANEFGTPCYVYSRAMLTSAFQTFDAAFAGIPHLVCYAMKANPTLAILD